MDAYPTKVGGATVNDAAKHRQLVQLQKATILSLASFHPHPRPHMRGKDCIVVQINLL
jgi:hypothetical protein